MRARRRSLCRCLSVCLSVRLSGCLVCLAGWLAAECKSVHADGWLRGAAFGQFHHRSAEVRPLHVHYVLLV